MARQPNDRIWNDFVRWCKKRHLKPMPAHPWTIAAFLRWMDSKDDGDSADAALKSISRAHLLCGRRSPHHHPMIERTLGSIYRRRASAPDRSNLFEARDFLSAANPSTVLPSHLVEDEVEPDDESENEEQAEAVPSSPLSRDKRRSMRSEPRLVSRRRIASGAS